MAEKIWEGFTNSEGDFVRFAPPPPNGDQLGGITQEERETIASNKDDYLAQQRSIDILDMNKLTSPASGLAVGKYFRVASIDEDGKAVLEAVDLPIATYETVGLIKPNVAYLTIKSDGTMGLNTASETTIDRRSVGRPLDAENLNYAVKATLTDSKRITMTDAEKAVACQTIGAEPKKGEWVLKGTMTLDRLSVNVDLTGCTEMIIVGTGSATSDTLIETNGGNNLIYAPISSSNRKFYARFVDGYFGYECIFAGRHSNQAGNFVSSGLTTYSSVNGTKISNVNKLLFGYGAENVTECNIQIYAR